MRSHQAGTLVQPSLFAPREGGSNRTRTSRAAAKSSTERAPTCRQRILKVLRYSVSGMTHEEIAFATNIRLDTVKPRVHELGAMGLVRALKQTRKSTAGAQVLVFVATEHVGRRALEPWPVPRTDWRSRALAAERRLAELEGRCRP